MARFCRLAGGRLLHLYAWWGWPMTGTCTNYHRVLHRDRWSLMVLNKLLLGLIIQVFLAESLPLAILVDDTLERREGKKIRHGSKIPIKWS